MTFKRPWTRAILATGLALSLSTTAFAERTVLGGNPPGSLFNSISNALATVVTNNSSLTVDVLPQGGTVYYPMMITGEVDFGLVNPFDAEAAQKGMPPYGDSLTSQGFKLSTVLIGKSINLSFVTTKDSGINSIKDLKGKRVVVEYGAFASSSITAAALLASAGMTKDDVIAVTVGSYPQGVKAVQEGRADAAVASLGSGVVQELDATRGARILSVDNTPAAEAGARQHGSSWEVLPVKPGIPGVAEPIHALGWGVPVLARADLGDDKVTEFLDAVWNNHAQLPGVFGWMRGWTPDKFVNKATSIPYHPAAIQYYKQKGVWTPEMDKVQAALQ
ncbi:MAG: TAXI family TRAP transporter solute-binding subunit [Gammaproteobacteria bacterium]|nr:TAXI family TRAP transporter solute-binding subunit [Gammaproteobacteria bacterium]